MVRQFIDTNVFIYHITNNHPDHSPRCKTLMKRIEAGDVEAVTAVTVVDEALRVLTRTFNYSRPKAAQVMSTLMSQPEFEIDHRRAVLVAISFWAEQNPLAFADCYHLALTEELGMTEIYTFDKKMDRYPGIERIEPS